LLVAIINVTLGGGYFGGGRNKGGKSWIIGKKCVRLQTLETTEPMTVDIGEGN